MAVDGKGCYFKIDRPVYQISDIRKDTVNKDADKVPYEEITDGRTLSCRLRSAVLSTIPSISWLSRYNVKDDLVKDIIAGCTVAIMNIPQGMAYALLAQLPPVVGIYMAIFPVVIYAFLGTSRHVSMGSFAVICLMVGNVVVEQMSHPSSEIASAAVANDTISKEIPLYSSIEIATAVSFVVGGFQLLMYVFRLGIVCSLLSETLISGFTAGAAVHVFTSQIKDLLGLTIPRHSGYLQIVYTYVDIYKNLSNINWVAVIVSCTTITILLINNNVIKPWLKEKSKFPVPIELIIVMAGTLVSKYYCISQLYGLKVVGHIDVGLPVAEPPPFALMPSILPESIVIAIVAYMISVSMALIFAQKLKYDINPNQELLAQGTGNIVGSFFSCAPFAASLSRSAIQETVGGKTQVASLVSSFILCVVLMWFGPFFEPLPRCTLSSLIVVALQSVLLQVFELYKIWKLSVLDGMVWLITYVTVIMVKIDIGLLVGLCAAVASIFIQGMKPYTCMLGRIPATNIYVDKTKYTQTTDTPGISIVHYTGGINFANRGYFKNEVYSLLNVWPKQMLAKQNVGNNKIFSINSSDRIRKVILDMSGIHYIDPSGAAAIKTLAEELRDIGIPMYAAAIPEPVYESFKANGLIELNLINLFPTIHDAVLFAQHRFSEDQTRLQIKESL